MNGCKLTSDELADLVKYAGDDVETCTIKCAVGIIRGLDRAITGEAFGNVFDLKLSILYQAIAMAFFKQICQVRDISEVTAESDDLFKEIVMKAGLSLQELGEQLDVMIDVKFS